jgi:hypothetical protein
MIVTILLAWLAIAAGEVTARQTQRQWPRLFCLAGSLLLTWQAWPRHFQTLEPMAHAESLTQEVVGVAASDTYHRPDCPMIGQIRYVSAEAAELMGRRPCRYCLRRSAASDLQTSLERRGQR